MSRRGRYTSDLSKRLRAAHKAGTGLDDLVAMSGGLSVAQVLYRIHPPARVEGRTYTRKANLIMDAEMHERLITHAHKEGVSPAEVMRTFIEWGLEECE